jgi:hypothetical protein
LVFRVFIHIFFFPYIGMKLSLFPISSAQNLPYIGIKDK